MEMHRAMKLRRISPLLWVPAALLVRAPASAMPAAAHLKPAARTAGLSLASAQAFQRKWQRLSEPAPSSDSLAPIIVTDQEVNSYLKFYGSTFLPPGVYRPILHIEPTGVQGTAVVNFDQLNSSESQSNELGGSLLGLLFKGWQPVRAFGRIVASPGACALTIQNVQIGETQLNDWLVNWLLQTYVESKYKIDLSQPLKLPPYVSRLALAGGEAVFYRRRGGK